MPLPADALLAVYAATPGCYTDCYEVDIPGAIPLADFVTAFYTTPLFQLERFILRVAVDRPSTDQDARNVATGARDNFAAWTVESRRVDQLLMCDMAGKTRSWFMVVPEDMTDAGSGRTRLRFGSAVVPRRGNTRLGTVFTLLLGVHKLYSRALLAAARRRLMRN